MYVYIYICIYHLYKMGLLTETHPPPDTVRDTTWGTVWKLTDDNEEIVLEVKPQAPPAVPSWWKYSEDQRHVVCLR